LSLSISRDNKNNNFKPPNIPQLNRKIVDGLNTTGPNQKNTASTSTATASTKRKALFYKAKKLKQSHDKSSDNRTTN